MSSSSLTSPQKFGLNAHTIFGLSSSSLRDPRQGCGIFLLPDVAALHFSNLILPSRFDIKTPAPSPPWRGCFSF
jgi:hypothetical protein